MPYISSIFRGIIAGLRAFWTLSTLLIFAAMLALNVATLTVSGVNTAVSGALTAISGVGTLASSSNLSLRETRASLAAYKTAASRFAGRNIKLVKQNSNLVVRNTKLVNAANNYLKRALILAGEIDLARKGAQILRTQSSAVRRAVKSTISTIRARTVKVAAVNVGSVFGESIPFWGAAVVVGVTGYELKNSCDTMRDLDALETKLLGEDTESAAAVEVCGREVPSKEEIWQAIKSSPKTVWDGTKSILPDVSEYDFSLPDPDFGGWWASGVTYLFGSE